MKKWMMVAGCIILALGLAACVASPPEDITPVASASIAPVLPQKAHEVKKIEYGEMYQADLDGDGQVENFIVQVPQACPDEGEPEAVKITVGNEDEGVTSVLSEGFQIGPIYQITTENGLRLLLCVDLGVDQGKITLHKFEQWKPVKLDEVYGYLHEWKDDIIHVRGDVDVLGTWNAEREYIYKNDKLVPAAGALWEIEDTDSVLMLIQPLKVRLQQPDGGEQEAMLEAGTELKIRATDGERIAKMQLRDGAIATISIDGFEAGQVMIDGKRDDYYFQSLPYSG